MTERAYVHSQNKDEIETDGATSGAKSHAIESRFDIRRKFVFEPREIEIAVKIGETAIRNCLRDQLEAIRKEGLEYTGNHPCVYTEIGIPYDMDDKYAYKTGDYSAQVAAMDANHFALEGSGAAG